MQKSSPRKRLKLSLAAGLILSASAITPAEASLDVLGTWTGNYGLSTDGGGSVGSSYLVNAFVPAGATVTAAYLYQATSGTTAVQTITLNGSTITFGAQTPNGTACCQIGSARADVTSLMASLINGGPGGTYSFTVGEGNSAVTDGVALAVVYSLASLPQSTVALLDGFASVDGDVTTLTFANPLNPTAAGFVADMRLGIGFSCCSQQSTVTVNGTTITTSAGNYDDGASLSNGSLITVGGDDDPFSPFNPTYTQDTERYNLASYINNGDTTITVRTANASRDDNIFLAAFRITGIASVTTPMSGVPELGTWAMMLIGFGAIGASMRRRRPSARLLQVG